jgi:hypothetical protein
MTHHSHLALAPRIGLSLFLALGLLGLLSPSASASGRRGTVLTKQVIHARFVELKHKALLKSKDMNYVGSTPKWHVFMRVETRAPKRKKGKRGMP